MTQALIEPGDITDSAAITEMLRTVAPNDPVLLWHVENGKPLYVWQLDRLQVSGLWGVLLTSWAIRFYLRCVMRGETEPLRHEDERFGFIWILPAGDKPVWVTTAAPPGSNFILPPAEGSH